MFMKKSLSEEDIEHIAWLARIELFEKEKQVFTQQFNTIIDYFRAIDGVNTNGVEPTFHVLNLSNVYREDIVEDSMSVKKALINATRKERGYFKASKIV